MKIRLGFVSNSSSSSFVVIDNNNAIMIPKKLLEYNVLRIPQDFGGITEFGWSIADHTDIGSRINFAILQAMYLYEDGTQMEMIMNVLKDNFHVDTVENNISLAYDTPQDKIWGYIDHQSSSQEGCNTEIFESEDTLTKFIFGPESFIHTDNDNH
jgi:hypothetical protein